jgi:hypothetical protein
VNFSFTYEVDMPNKILICEAVGAVSKVLEIEHMLKNIVKLAGKNQVKNVVLDETQFQLNYSKMDMTSLFLALQEEDWLGEIKIARIINPQDNTQHLVGEMAARYSLAIKNFDDRSDAMMWLLFNK